MMQSDKVMREAAWLATEILAFSRRVVRRLGVPPESESKATAELAAHLMETLDQFVQEHTRKP
jgi:hypothetical protein